MYTDFSFKRISKLPIFNGIFSSVMYLSGKILHSMIFKPPPLNFDLLFVPRATFWGNVAENRQKMVPRRVKNHGVLSFFKFH